MFSFLVERSWGVIEIPLQLQLLLLLRLLGEGEGTVQDDLLLPLLHDRRDHKVVNTVVEDVVRPRTTTCLYLSPEQRWRRKINPRYFILYLAARVRREGALVLCSIPIRILTGNPNIYRKFNNS